MVDAPFASSPHRASRRQGDARSGAPSDWLRVSWLIETARRVFTHWGGENLRDLLAAPGAVVWQQGRALRGALLADMPRRDVAEARLVAVHDDADLMHFGAEALSLVERRLAHRGARWLSFSNPGDWLLELLVPRGYVPRDRIITYALERVDVEAPGNPGVTVDRALPEHLPGMLAVDAAAFEPFWRLDREVLRRALDEQACVLVAQGLPPLSVLGERVGQRGTEAQGLPPRPVPGERVGERGTEVVVGYLIADTWGPRAHIVRLGVAPEHRGQGVATRLIAEALRRIAPERIDTASRNRPSDPRQVIGNDVHEVTLNTQETNVRARALYERLGFRVTGGVEEVWARALEPPPDED